MADSVLYEQVGGSHYTVYEIQPVVFIHKNRLPFIIGNVIKYVCRYNVLKDKEDLLKAKHYIDLLIELDSCREDGGDDKA